MHIIGLIAAILSFNLALGLPQAKACGSAPVLPLSIDVALSTQEIPGEIKQGQLVSFLASGQPSYQTGIFLAYPIRKNFNFISVYVMNPDGQFQGAQTLELAEVGTLGTVLRVIEPKREIASGIGKMGKGSLRADYTNGTSLVQIEKKQDSGNTKIVYVVLATSHLTVKRKKKFPRRDTPRMEPDAVATD